MYMLILRSQKLFTLLVVDGQLILYVESLLGVDITPPEQLCVMSRTEVECKKQWVDISQEKVILRTRMTSNVDKQNTRKKLVGGDGFKPTESPLEEENRLSKNLPDSVKLRRSLGYLT